MAAMRLRLMEHLEVCLFVSVFSQTQVQIGSSGHVIYIVHVMFCLKSHFGSVRGRCTF